MADNKTRFPFLKVDTDTDPASLQQAGALDSARNLWFNRGSVTGALGNQMVDPSYGLSGGTNAVIGSCEDNAGGLYYFLYNSAGLHRLVHYTAGTLTTVLEGAFLNLAIDTPVLGATVLDGLLIYVDASGALRSIPTDSAQRGLAVAALAADPFALHLVHQPPQGVPTASREVNDSLNDPRAKLSTVANSAYQFALQYVYPSGERTPLGPYSAVLPVLRKDNPDQVDPRNFIRVAYPSGSLAASPLVSSVRLLVRAQGADVWQVAGTFTSGVAFDFYGGTTGEAIPAADAAKLSEALPVRVGCMTVAKSRVFAGDCTEGYAPTLPVEALTVVAGPLPTAPSTSITVYRTQTAYLIPYDDGDIIRYEAAQRVLFYQLVSGTYPDAASTYRLLDQVGGAYYPSANTATFTYAQAFIDFQADEVIEDGRTVTVLTGNLVGSGTPPAEEATLHENSVYPVGIAFYDALGRTAGAESVRAVLVPRQDYTNPVAQNARWTLGSSYQPPIWAVSYQLLLGQNRTASALQQFKTDQLQQFKGDGEGGAPMLSNLDSGGSAANKAIWVSLTPLLTGGRGYTFEQGDRLRFPAITSAPADFPILYTRSGYAAISAAALSVFYDTQGNTLNDFLPIVEVYRPAALVDSPVLYERGPRYAIDSPGTDFRAFSVSSGVLAGDAYLVPFQFGGATQTLEAVNPGLSDYELWLDASRGRAIPVLPAGAQTRRSSLVRYSGVKVAGTKLMGLSVWDATGQDDLPQQQRAVVRLAVADQTQADGSLLLCVQERGAESRYLGQTALQQADGQTTLALTKGVMGGGNALRGGYGCLPRHAATLVSFGGKAWWWCQERSEYVRYAQNGITPLGLTYQFRTRLSALASLLGHRAAHGGYDPRRDELWLTFPAPATVLLPGTGDLDQLPQEPTNEPAGQTLVWSERRETWADACSALPEHMAHAGDTLLSFRDGAAWVHTTDERAVVGSFFGFVAAPTLRFTVVAGAGGAKLWKNINLESESKWLPTSLIIGRAGQPPMQSQMKAPWLTYLEGMYKGAFRRDENSAGGLLNGRPLVGERLHVELTAPDDPTPLAAATLGWVPRSGA
jgi:hypothetical protein